MLLDTFSQLCAKRGVHTVPPLILCATIQKCCESSSRTPACLSKGDQHPPSLPLSVLLRHCRELHDIIMEARGANAVVSLAQLTDEECQVRSCHQFHLQTTWDTSIETPNNNRRMHHSPWHTWLAMILSRFDKPLLHSKIKNNNILKRNFIIMYYQSTTFWH